MKIAWGGTHASDIAKYVCGYCSCMVAPASCYSGTSVKNGERGGVIYICPGCSAPTFFDRFGNQFPGVRYGDKIENIPDRGLVSLYEELRRAMSVSAFSIVVAAGRKLLMHVSVDQGAEPGQNFVSYVDFLVEHVLPRNARGWVDRIREMGNEANHEIIIHGKEDAKQLVDFIAMILKIIYDYPARIKKSPCRAEGDPEPGTE